MTTEPEPAEVMVGMPVATLRLMVGGIIVVILLMLAILAFEILILFRVLDLIDLVEKVVPSA